MFLLWGNICQSATYIPWGHRRLVLLSQGPLGRAGPEALAEGNGAAADDVKETHQLLHPGLGAARASQDHNPDSK